MMRLQEPVTKKEFWITPGGSVKLGESDAEALSRELGEETGQRGFCVGPLLWTREMTYTWDGRTVSQSERYYLVETEEFEAAMEEDPTSGEVRAFREFGWWSAEAIEASEGRFGPREIVSLLRSLVENGVPPRPISLGKCTA